MLLTLTPGPKGTLKDWIARSRFMLKSSVFIVPHAATQVGDFVTHKPDTIVARIRSELVHRGVRPGLMAGCIRTVLAVGVKVKVLGPPLIENGR